MNFVDLFNTTGHGPFILASYGISFVVLLWNVFAAVLEDRRLKREIRNEIQMRKPTK